MHQLESQEANDLAQFASGYRVSKEKLEELIEVKEKLTSTGILPSKLSTSKLVGVEGYVNCKIMELLKFFLLTICQIVTGKNQL